MIQQSLFDQPPRLHRKRDPQTSVKAAQRVEEFRKRHEAEIYAAICDAGSRGATYREIAAVTGMEPVAVGRRLSAMGKRHLIERRLKRDSTKPDDWQERDRCAVWWKK